MKKKKKKKNAWQQWRLFWKISCIIASRKNQGPSSQSMAQRLGHANPQQAKLLGAWCFSLPVSQRFHFISFHFISSRSVCQSRPGRRRGKQHVAVAHVLHTLPLRCRDAAHTLPPSVSFSFVSTVLCCSDLLPRNLSSSQADGVRRCPPCPQFTMGLVRSANFGGGRLLRIHGYGYRYM